MSQPRLFPSNIGTGFMSSEFPTTHRSPHLSVDWTISFILPHSFYGAFFRKRRIVWTTDTSVCSFQTNATYNTWHTDFYFIEHQVDAIQFVLSVDLDWWTRLVRVPKTAVLEWLILFASQHIENGKWRNVRLYVTWTDNWQVHCPDFWLLEPSQIVLWLLKYNSSFCVLKRFWFPLISDKISSQC